MEKFYEIKNIKVVFVHPVFCDELVEGYYSSGNDICVRQFMYVDGRSMVDIFGDSYLKGLYYHGEMPGFCYNPINDIDMGYFTEDEKRSGKVSEMRLLQIYCMYNSDYLTFENLACPFGSEDEFRVVDIKRGLFKKRFLGISIREKEGRL